MDDNMDLIAELLFNAKGDRTLREYGADTDVSYSNIQRILKQKYKPTPDTIRKMTLGDRHPQGNVSYEDLMIAAGYMSAETRDREDEYFRELGRQEEVERTEFLTRTELIIFGGLIQSGFRFQKLESKKKFHEFSPDLTVDIEGFPISKWLFRFVQKAPRPERRNGKLLVKNIPSAYARRMLAETVLIAPDEDRKLSVVTDFADYYDEMLNFKENISYKGELSIILIDAKSMCVIKEEYLTHENNTLGFFICKPETT